MTAASPVSWRWIWAFCGGTSRAKRMKGQQRRSLATKATTSWYVRHYIVIGVGGEAEGETVGQLVHFEEQFSEQALRQGEVGLALSARDRGEVAGDG